MVFYDYIDSKSILNVDTAYHIGDRFILTVYFLPFFLAATFFDLISILCNPIHIIQNIFKMNLEASFGST